MNKIASVSAAILFALATTSYAQTDTVKVMAYNVLYYGSGCQGPNGKLHEHLNKIINFTQPDILSLEKMASPKLTPDDKYGTAPLGFGDSILKFALNTGTTEKYAYCPFTNAAQTNNVAMLFYNQQKLGYAGMVCSYTNVTDFNTYKLYYKDPNLQNTHDTTFLYLTLNHDKSGDEFEEVRTSQISGTMNAIRQHFTSLPNYISLGDFNARGADEGFYQLLTATPDSAFRVYDPPFFPDRKLKYPAHWDHEGQYTAYFTTSTRESAVVPNNCGSGGGGKNWYDHIFISKWLIDNTDHVRYIPQSYRTVGNDGQRYRVSINNRNSHVNTSAPADVIDAMYQFSNKYPVMIDLEVTPNKTGTSVAGTEVPYPVVTYKDEVNVTSPFTDELIVNFPESYKGQEVTVKVLDVANKQVLGKKFTVKKQIVSLKWKGPAGNYQLNINGKHNAILSTTVVKQ